MNQSQGHLGKGMLEAILQSAVGGIIVINRSGIIQNVNPATERLFGYSESEMLFRNVSMLMPASHAQHHDGYIQHHLRTGERRIIGVGREVQALHKSGTMFPVHLSVSAFDVDGEIYFAGIIVDLSARFRLEGEISRQSALFTSVFDHVPEPLIIADDKQSVRFVNPAVSRVFGGGASELIGRNIAIIFESASEFLRIEQLLSKQATAARSDTPLSAQFRRSSGDLFPGQLMVDEIREHGGERIGKLWLIRDMTAQEKQEEARLRTQRLEAIGQLTGGVAHDFNNLLTIISGNLELMSDDVQSEAGLDHLKRAQSAAEAGSRLTNRLLTFARRRRLEPQLVDLNEHVLSMTELLKRTLGANIELTAKLAPDLWKTLIDPSEIENAILNLAINSRDAMPNGGKLVIQTSNAVLDGEATLSEGAVAPGNYVRMSVADSGSGMSREVQRRAFEPFFTTKPSGRGTGLGLSTIYGFIKQSNGNVVVYSEPGKGTIVNLYLPQWIGNDPLLAPKMPEQPARAGQGEIILVVEDNSEVRAVAIGRLQRLGYEVIEAGNAVEAISLLSDGIAVDAVFSDVVMPGGRSGLDLAQWIAAHRSELPILLTSGFSEDIIPQTVSASLQVLRKPYTQAELASQLRAVIAAKQK